MRVLSGKYKGLQIKAPENIRPTLELVRKVIFSILGDSLVGARFLELFCGSGIVGIEALSLGAKELVCVDNSFKSVSATKTNLFTIVKNDNNYKVYNMDAVKFIKLHSSKEDKFDIVFLDPPYYRELTKKTLISLGAYDILTRNGVVVCQHYKKDLLLQESGVLTQFKQKTYGDTTLTFYEKSTISGDI